MSGIDCEHPDHEQCGICGGCVVDGCICHLTGGEGAPEDACEDSRELVELEMGLREFSGEISCPKCGMGSVQVSYHSMPVMVLGDEIFPCQEWIEQGLLTPNTTQHLCIRCARCRYGWPTKTRDA